MGRSTRATALRPGNVLNELLLYSGQYALFYILMNFSDSGLGYFQNAGHDLLLAVLVGQTIVLVMFGRDPLVRFAGSLIAPLIYSLNEMREGFAFVFNVAHVFFWVFSILVGALQAASLKARRRPWQYTLEYLITTVNVMTFLFIYFVYDLQVTYQGQVAAGALSPQQMQSKLTVFSVWDDVGSLLKDSTHVFVLAGGLFMSVALSVGRVKLLALKEQINELFGTYVDRDYRDRIVAESGGRSESRDVAILFSDIRDFTTISESNSADAITAMLNRYFGAWERVVASRGGKVDKFIGDAIMVIFEGPRAAQDATASAIELLGRLPSIQSELRAHALPNVERIGIGINFGRAILGDIGSEHRRNYTAIGDTVNTASRLEHLTRNVHSDLVVSESVYSRLDEELARRFRNLGVARLKGKAKGTAAFGYVPAKETL